MGMNVDDKIKNWDELLTGNQGTDRCGSSYKSISLKMNGAQVYLWVTFKPNGECDYISIENMVLCRKSTRSSTEDYLRR